MCTIFYILSTIVCRSIPASFSKLDCSVFQNRILWVSVLPPLCVRPSHPSSQTFPRWPIMHFSLPHNPAELAFKFKFSIIVHKNQLHHQGQGHPIENFANVSNERNILRIQFLYRNTKGLYFLAKIWNLKKKDTLPISREICSTSSWLPEFPKAYRGSRLTLVAFLLYLSHCLYLLS